MTQASATLPPPPSSSITTEEEAEAEAAGVSAQGGSLGHRRTQSLELSEAKMPVQAFEVRDGVVVVVVVVVRL